MTRYSHQQRSRWTALIGLPLSALMIAAVVFAEPMPVIARTALITGALLTLWLLVDFSRLSVAITHEIRVLFGRGRPCRTLDPARVTGQRVVRDSPWHGWGHPLDFSRITVEPCGE